MSALAEPHVHLWTRSEYQNIAEFGFFERQHVELIEGQVIDMSPMGSEHATAVTLTARTLERTFETSYFVRWQMPFAAGEFSEPEPDVAVIAGDIRDYATEPPTSAALIVEVADTSLAYDRNEKASLYAKARIAEYWIVNLVERQLEVYRCSVADKNTPYGFGYADKTVLTLTENIAPLTRQHATIAVADLLP